MNFSKGLIATIIIGVFVLITAFACIGTYNNLVSLEQGIEASYKDNQNVYSSITNNMKSQGLVVKEYEDAVLKSIDKAIQGRYGTGGAKQAILFLKEDNPRIDPAIFSKLSAVIEAGYNKFEAAQTSRLDRIRIYKTELRSFPNNMLAGALGFPKIDLAKYETIVVSSDTKKAFETGIADPVNPLK